ncbi:MAG: hypothetical protein ABFS32_06740 [Bacteroidota bacterium]
MTLPDTFFEISIPEQCRILYLEGEFMMAIRYYKYKVNLYLLGDKYVEVFYNHKFDRIHKIQELDYNSSRINFYIDQINITELLDV